MNFLLIFLIALFPPSAGVAKPCDPICTDAEECEPLAEWIADGTITNVEHDKVGFPVHKDYASFDFTPKKMLKGDDSAVGKPIRYKVDWCNNSRGLPKNIEGTFRFFGKKPSGDEDEAPVYLFFEKTPD